MRLKKSLMNMLVSYCLLQSYKSDFDDEIDEGFWLRYMLGTWLRQVVDELAIHEVYS